MPNLFPNLPSAKPQTVTTKETEKAIATNDMKADEAESIKTAEGTPTIALEEAMIDLESLPSIMKSADRAVEKVATKPKSVVRQQAGGKLRDPSEGDVSGFVETRSEPITLDTPIDLTTPITDNEIITTKPAEKSWESVAKEPEKSWEGIAKQPEKAWEAITEEPSVVGLQTAEQVDEVASEVKSPEPERNESVVGRQQSPILFAKAKGPQTIIVGRRATYEIQLESQNEHSAKDVSVLVNIPSWVEVDDKASTVGSCQLIPDDNGHSLVKWTIDHLPGSATEKLTLKLIPRQSRAIDLAVNWMFKPSTTITHIQVQEPKLEMSVTGPHEVFFGDTQLYTISVSNPGTGDAENVVLHLLPVVPTENTAGTKQIGVLKAGERQTIKVELTARQAGELQVRAQATGDGGLQASDFQDVIVRRASLIVPEVEPNNTLITAQNVDNEEWNFSFTTDIGDVAGVNTSTSIPHITINGTGDNSFDYYEFTVTGASMLDPVTGIFDIDGGSGGVGSMDAELFLFDAATGVVLAENDDALSIVEGAGGSTSTLDSFLQFDFDTDGQYVIAVAEWDSNANTGGINPTSNEIDPGDTYTLQISLEDHANFNTHVTAASGGLDAPEGIVFGPDGNLYVASSTTDEILRYDGLTGAFLNTFVTAGSAGLDEPRGLAFDVASGDLFVSSGQTDEILRFNGLSGLPVGTGIFVAAGSGGLSGPVGLVFDTVANELLVASSNTDRVLRYDEFGFPVGGTGVYVNPNVGGLDNPQDLAIDGTNLFVASHDTDQVLRYNLNTGAFLANATVGSPLDEPSGCGR